MTLAVVAGVGIGASLWLLISGLMPAPDPLDSALARLGRPIPEDTQHTSNELDARLGGWLRKVPLIDRAIGLVRSDLRVLDRNPDEQAAEIAAYAMGGLLWAPVVALAAWTLLGIGLPVVVPVWLSVVGAGIAVWVSVRRVRERAREARDAFNHALSAYCDVLSMTLSAGRGLNAAVFEAATQGEGWAWAEIHQALQRGFLAGERRPWESLARLGHDLGVEDLVELAAVMALAHDEGASVADSVASKAASLRERLVTSSEQRAASATERMAVPGAMVLIGFVILLAFPALHVILRQAG